MKLFERIFCSCLALSTVIASLIGIGNADWNIGKDTANVADDTFSTSSVSPICLNESTGAAYSSLLRAMSDANSVASSSNAQVVTILPGNTIDVSTENLVIKSYVTLNLPFVKEGATYICDQTDTSKLKNYAGGRVSTLRMRGGYDIKVNANATLNIGGIFTTTGNCGKYCEVNLGSGCSIEVAGTLNCYGFVRENSTDAIGFFANEAENIGNGNDIGRLIEVTSSGTLNTFMNIRDAMSGSALGAVLQSHDLCPFNVWDFNALQTYVSIQHGGRLNADAIMTISSNIVRQRAGIVGSSDSILLLGNGSGVSIEYCPKKPATLDNTKGNHYTNIVTAGNVSLGTLYINGGSGLYLDTSKCFMPFSYNFNVYVSDGSAMTLGHQVKFLPGSAMKVCSGGSIECTSDLIFYQEAKCPDSWNYPDSCGDAEFIVDGTFTCTGNIGALIQTTSDTEDGATLDFSGINADSHFSATSVETISKTDVKVDSKGKFLQDDELVESTFSTQETYSSGDPSIGYYWKGNTVTSINITVTIASSDYAHPISTYTLSSSDTASGTKSEIVKTDTAYTTTIPNGKYLTVDWIRSAGVSITNRGSVVDTSNGTSVTFLPSGAVDIVVTPSDSIVVDTQYGKNYFQTEYPSGSGGGTTTIKESLTSNGAYYTVASLTGGAQNGTTYVVKGRYFKVTVTEGGGLSDIDHRYVWKPENYDTKWTTTGRATHNESTAYSSYGNYAFYWEWKVQGGGSCVLPDTMVTLADGSKRPIKDVAVGDMLLAFDHERGGLTAAPVVFNEKDQATWQNVIYLEFGNGSKVGVISEHGFFDMDTSRYEYIDETNYDCFVGHRFYCEDGTTTTLEKAYVVCEYTECYELPTFYHLDFFTEGILSMPGGIQGLFNIYEYGEDLRYDEEAYARDVAEYGLFEYADLEPYGVTEEMFDAYGGKNLKVALGKGVLTEEYLAYLIERYGKYTE